MAKKGASKKAAADAGATAADGKKRRSRREITEYDGDYIFDVLRRRLGAISDPYFRERIIIMLLVWYGVSGKKNPTDGPDNRPKMPTKPQGSGEQPDSRFSPIPSGTQYEEMRKTLLGLVNLLAKLNTEWRRWVLNRISDWYQLSIWSQKTWKFNEASDDIGNNAGNAQSAEDENPGGADIENNSPAKSDENSTQSESAGSEDKKSESSSSDDLDFS
jgi:hypothetical protein